jgi:hypothetical protein
MDSEVDLEILGKDGFNCLQVACGSGNIEMVKYLLENK